MLKKIFLSLNITIPVGIVLVPLSMAMVFLNEFLFYNLFLRYFGVSAANIITAGIYISLFAAIIYMIFPIIAAVVSIIVAPPKPEKLPYYFMGQDKQAQEVLKNGRLASATVLESGEASKEYVVTMGEDPYVSLKVTIDDGFRQPYEVSLAAALPRLDIPKFQPGAKIKVKVDPNNPNNIVFAGKQ